MQFPWIIKWNITDNCNLKCKHCFRSGNSSYVSRQDADLIIDDLSNNSVALVALTGGEPFTSPNLLYIIQRLKAKGIKVEIATNGTLFDRELCIKIFEEGVKGIQISLDGIDQSSNDFIRGNDNFRRIIYAIKEIKRIGFSVTIATTLNARNIFQIDEFVALKNALGTSAIRFELYIPVRDNDSSLRLTARDLSIIKEKKDYYSFDSSVIFPRFDSLNNCGAGRSMCTINADKTISPCDLLSDTLRSKQIISSSTSIRKIIMEDECFKNWDTSFFGCKVAFDIYKSLKIQLNEALK